MKKPVIIIAAVSVVLLICILAGVGTYLLINNGKDASNSDNSSDSEDSSDQNEQEESIADLLDSNNNVQCTWDYTDQGQDSTGKIYISNGKMRQDVTSGGEDLNIIYSGEDIYYWSEGTNQGFKLKSENLEEDIDANADAYTDYGDLYDNLDFDSNYNFDCDDWNVDNSLFTPPSDVEFIDFNNIFEQFGDL